MAKIAVAPLVGAWIEICISKARLQHNRSLPSWERGLKYNKDGSKEVSRPVAPLVGAWIEMVLRHPITQLFGSLPSWERGLKSDYGNNKIYTKQSLPSWERGLKS